MKQMLKEMKINSLLSVLHIILGLGGLGIVLLVLQRDNLMQLLGVVPRAAETKNEDFVLCIMAAVMIAFALWLLFHALSGRSVKRVKEYLSGMDAGEQERLFSDYRNAWRGSRMIRVGARYTFVLSDSARIYQNSNIIWIYEWNEKISRNGVSKKNYYFNLYLLDQEEPEILQTTEKTYVGILEYYQNNFSHIVVGDSDEARYLYRNDRNQFLQLRYHNGLNR